MSPFHCNVENSSLQQYERISQLKCPKDMVKVLDIDWAASDKPVLATQDGCLRIMDMTLATSYSPLMDYELQGVNFTFLFGYTNNKVILQICVIRCSSCPSISTEHHTYCSGLAVCPHHSATLFSNNEIQ